MVKIHDGSLVPASELISGTVEDDEGNPLKFKEVKDAPVPTYQAISKVDERTVRVFRFGFDDTPIRVSMLVQEKGKGEGAEEGKETPSTEKAVKEVSATDTKKNSIGSSSSSSSSSPTGTTFGRK